MSFVIDMREKNEVAEFSDSPAADIDLARTFWTSVQLQPPPMESRLVSSDIKQRLKVASSRRSKEGAACSENQDKTEKFLYKAKRLTELDQFKKYQWYMQVREEQLERLAKRRKERMQIEEKAGQENDAEIFLKMKLKFEENVRKAEERARETWAMRAEIRSFEEKKNLDSDDNSEGK